MTAETWHGTAGGYRNHGCGCDPCTEAHNQTHRESEAVARERGRRDPSLIPHGIPSAYVYWGCRCEICTPAWSAYSAKRRAAKRKDVPVPLR